MTEVLIAAARGEGVKAGIAEGRRMESEAWQLIAVEAERIGIESGLGSAAELVEEWRRRYPDDALIHNQANVLVGAIRNAQRQVRASISTIPAPSSGTEARADRVYRVEPPDVVGGPFFRGPGE